MCIVYNIAKPPTNEFVNTNLYHCKFCFTKPTEPKKMHVTIRSYRFNATDVRVL